MFKKIMGFLTDLLGAGRKAGFWQKDQTGVVPTQGEIDLAKDDGGIR